jgi:hypothetical protein
MVDASLLKPAFCVASGKPNVSRPGLFEEKQMIMPETPQRLLTATLPSVVVEYDGTSLVSLF